VKTFEGGIPQKSKYFDGELQNMCPVSKVGLNAKYSRFENSTTGGKCFVAKAIYREQAAFVVNDVIAIKSANSYTKSNGRILTGSGAGLGACELIRTWKVNNIPG